MEEILFTFKPKKRLIIGIISLLILRIFLSSISLYMFYSTIQELAGRKIDFSQILVTIILLSFSLVLLLGSFSWVSAFWFHDQELRITDLCMSMKDRRFFTKIEWSNIKSTKIIPATFKGDSISSIIIILRVPAQIRGIFFRRKTIMITLLDYYNAPLEEIIFVLNSKIEKNRISPTTKT